MVLPRPGSYYKVFLVEVNDEDRERVLSGVASMVEVNVEPERMVIHSDYHVLPVAEFIADNKVSLTIDLMANEDGSYFRIENFKEQDEAHEDD